MPYLEPEVILRRFSKYLVEEVRPALDDEFLRGQVGSMSSTLRFLSMELEEQKEAVERQRDDLLTAFDEVAAVTEDETVCTAVESATETISNVSGDEIQESEAKMLEASNRVLGVIEDELTGEAAQRARKPMYKFLRTRVQTQLKQMGREST